MGTIWSLALAGGPADPRAIVARVAAEVIAESSLWAAESEISRFNRAAPGSIAALSPGFAQAIAAALAVAADSGGAFDPALGEHAALWGFGPAGEQPLPAALPPAGRWRELALRDGHLAQPGGVHLDLNGIAKGQAVDRVAAALRDAGCRQFLFGIGGEYHGEGVRPDGQPWWIETEQPPGAALPPLRIALANAAVATSGDYRRAFLHGGRSLSHSIDPATGRPIVEGVASVTVLGESCMLADAEATAITVLGPDRGMRWAETRGLAVQMLVREEGGFRECLSPALAAMLA